MATSINSGESTGGRQAAPAQEKHAHAGYSRDGQGPSPTDAGPADAAAGAKSPIHFIGRRSTAAALVAGALLNTASSFLNTVFLPGEVTAVGYTEAFSERAGVGMLGVLLNIVAIPLMLAGIAGLLQLASPKAPLISRIALAATTVGMVAFLCMNGALAALYSFGSGGTSAAEAAAEQLTASSPGMLALLLPFLLGNAVGMVCTAIALLKSRATAVWVPVALLLFLVLDFLVPVVPFFDAHLIFLAFSVGAAASVLPRPQRLFPQHRP